MANLDSTIWRIGRKCLFKTSVHLVFLTKHKQALTQQHLERLEELFKETCEQMKSQLISFSGDPGHVHLQVLIHPTISISKLAGKLKSKTSYLLVKEFSTELKDKLVKNHFWASSYCAISGEEQFLEIVKDFIYKNNETIR